MVQINYSKGELGCKIVLCGPPFAGKTACLQAARKQAEASGGGRVVEVTQEGDLSLCLEYAMPDPEGSERSGKLALVMRLYTAPGVVLHDATHRIVLRGADGVIFVADAQAERLEENVESLAKLEENAREVGLDPKTLRMAFLWNKSDLPNALPAAKLNAALNQHDRPAFESVGTTGQGVLEALEHLQEGILELATRERPGVSKGPLPSERRGPKPKPKPKPKPEQKSEPLPQPQPKPKPRAKAKAKPEQETEPMPKPEPKPEPTPQQEPALEEVPSDGAAPEEAGVPGPLWVLALLLVIVIGLEAASVFGVLSL